MTVRELINELEECNPDARVHYYGTDFYKNYHYLKEIKTIITKTGQPKEVSDKIELK